MKTVLEVDKTRKLYFEEEHMAHDARGKAHDVEEKLKKKKGGIFSSISSLQKKNDKVGCQLELVIYNCTSSCLLAVEADLT